MELTNNWILIVATMIICAIFGGNLGNQREAFGTGALLGLLLGPFGVIAAALVDGREQCPQCQERIFKQALICPHCEFLIKPPTPAGTLAQCEYCKAMIDSELTECPHCHVQVFKTHRSR